MIFLTSCIADSAEHIYKNFLHDKGYERVLFIDTAAERDEKDGEWLLRDIRGLEDQGYHVHRYTITGHSADEIEKKIAEHDIIYMCGGNTFYLLQQLQKTRSMDTIRTAVASGVPYIGTSAGSLIAGPDIAPTKRLGEPDKVIDLTDTRALGLVDFLTLPHWGGDYFRNIYLGERIEKMYDDIDHKYILLNDYQYVHVADNGYIKIYDARSLRQ